VTIGLDLGSYQFRSLRPMADRLLARSCPAVFITLADTPAHRKLLQQSSTRFATCSDQLLVFGEPAREWSAMLNLPLIPLLRGGRIPPSDPISRQVLTLMVDALLPAATVPGTICSLTIPGSGNDIRLQSRDAEFFQQLVALRGYRPQCITATQALVLAELNEASFTGIGVSLGHATSEFGIVHCGREIVRCVVMSGLESFEDSPALGGQTAGSESMANSAAVERAYVRFFTDVVAEARTQFERDGTLRTLPHPMPVVCTGAITSEPSFLPLMQRVWDESKWPVATLPLRCSRDPHFSVARGCVIQAELEQPGEQRAA
jgi:hypothetical protein